MNFIPKPHQVAMQKWIIEHERCALFCFMGAGKTAVTLTSLIQCGITENILVIAPARVAQTTWPDEVQKWTETKDLSTIPICGTTKQREKCLKIDCNIHTINFESLPWLVNHLGSKWPFTTVIVDESTKLKSFRTRQGSIRAKALARVAHTLVKRIILLTGTPAPNGCLDLWGQIWFIDKGDRLGRTFSAFQEKWFYQDYSGFKWLPKTGAQDEIQNLIKNVCLTIKPEDWVQLDVPLVNKIFVELPSKTGRLYKQMEKDMFIELENNDISAFNAASVSMKCRQIAVGAVYNDNGGYDVLHDQKLDALESIVEEHAGQPLIVAYHFTSDLDRLRERFPLGKTLGDGEDIQRQWNAGEIPILFINPQTGGHGLNLQFGGNILVFFSLDWNLELYLQCIERIGPVRQRQAGFDRPVFLHYILTKNTIDELIYNRLESKKSVQEVLLDAMRRN